MSHEVCAYTRVTNYVTLYGSHELCVWMTMTKICVISIPSCIHEIHELCACIWVTNYVTLYMGHELFERMTNICMITIMYSRKPRTMCVYMSHELCDFMYGSRTVRVSDECICDKHVYTWVTNSVRVYESRTMWLYTWVTNFVSEWWIYVW